MLFALSSFTGTAGASWAPNGNTASLAVENQVNAQSISDGAGGIIIVWQDYRLDPQGDPPDFVDSSYIYVQRLSSSGTPMWAADGVRVCTNAQPQQAPVICSDGAGGAIMAWQDLRSGAYDIYVQAVSAAGALKWPSDGVLLCGATNNQVLEVIASDNAGGAIVAWRDSRSGDSDVYARRVNSTGAPLWTADGVAVCVQPETQTDIRILPDQQGGAFLSWRDARNGLSSNDIYAQSLDSSGAPRWAANGAVVCDDPSDQREPRIVNDGRYGLIVTWHDFRPPAGKIFAQRLGPTGSPLWPANGVPLGAAAVGVSDPQPAGDGLAGVIVAWNDPRGGAKAQVYAQRADSLGVTLWATDGIGISPTDSAQAVITGISDGLGGAIFGWDDERSAGTDLDIFAQSVAPDGSLRWSASGLLVATAAGTRRLTTSAPDGYGGALFGWEDFRGGTTSDVYAIRLTSLGTGVGSAGVPRTPARLYPARPNPFNPRTTLDFSLDAPSHFRFAIHDVRGRLVRLLEEGDAGAGRRSYTWDGLNEVGAACGSGVYFAVLTVRGAIHSTPLTLLR